MSAEPTEPTEPVLPVKPVSLSDLYELKYYNSKQAAEILSTSPQRLANLRNQGKGPPYSKIGTSIRYSPTDLKEFMDSKRVVPGGDK